ncbi:MAG: flagellar protein FlgN [Deltaproteobacteria bacterium]|nr:flagellar protein FlgN [Deltaproteobacteria bacterium]
MVKQFITTLRQEIGLYKELIAHLQEEKQLLARRRRDELYQIANTIETLVFKIKGVDGLRSRMAEELVFLAGAGQRQGVASVGVTLTTVIGVVEEYHKGELMNLQSIIASLVDTIKELNRENSIITSRSIENINTAFQFLQELSTTGVYKPTGKLYDSRYE